MADNPYAVLANENAPAIAPAGETNPYAEIQRDDVLKEAPDPSYVDRFKLNVEAGKRYNTVGGALADAVGPQAKLDRQWFDKSYNSFPEWSGFLEGSTALAGQLVGTAASPENFVPIGLGEKIVALSGRGVSALWSRVFAGSVDGAVINAATDLAIQGVEIQAGHRESFDPVQYGIGILLGAGIGGAGGGVARGIEKLAAGSAAKIDAPADPARGIEADPMNGRTVTIADDQANAPAGMVRVVLEDGQSTLVGESILSPSGPKTPERVTGAQTAAPASPQSSQPANAAVARPVPQAEPVGPVAPRQVPAAEPVGGGAIPRSTPDAAAIPDVVGNDGLTLVHGSGNPNLTLKDIEIVRTGQKQAKKGRTYGGLYTHTEGDAALAEGYSRAEGGSPSLYDVKVKPGTRILNAEGDVTRLSAKRIEELKAQGVGVIVGKDPRGRSEWVVIDKDAIDFVSPRKPGGQSSPVSAEPIGERLSNQAAAVRGLSVQEKRILNEEAPSPGKAPQKPRSLARWLAENGGIQNQGGELGALDLNKVFVPGAGRLVREGGMTLDRAREMAAQNGYLWEFGSVDDATAKTSVADFLSTLERDARGEKVYSEHDRAAVENLTGHEDATAARASLRQNLDQLSQEIDAALPDEIVVRAAEHMDDGFSAPDALERAIMEDYYANGAPIALERSDGTEIPFFDDGAGLPAQRQADARASGDGEPARPGNAVADSGPARSAGQDQIRTERTDAGQQTLIDGIAPITDADRLAARAEKPLRGGDKAPGGLFDDAARDQTDISEFMNMAAPHAAARNRPVAGIAKVAVENIARVRETAEALAKALDVSATRQGRITGGSRVLGTYGTRSGVVRVRSLDDFDTLTHEYGHHLEAKLKDLGPLKKKHAAELEPMAYAGANKKHLLSEGFAEFFRLWVTNRPAAEKAAPQFAAAFDQSLKANVPDMAAAIDAARDAWTTFLDAPSTVAVASTIVSAKEKGWLGKSKEALQQSGVAGTIGEVLQRFYTFTFDALNPINRAVRALSDLHMQNTGKPINIKVSDDPHKLALMSRGAFSAGHMDLVHGVVPYRATNPASPSLRDALIEAMGKPNFLSKWEDGSARDFGSYLWSRRALGEWDRYDQGSIPNPPDKLTRGDHLQNVADLEAANPQYVSAADKVHQFALEMWKKKRDAGLITSEQYDEGLLIRDYVPGRRDFSETADGQISGKPSGGKAKSGFVRRFGGSKKDVINPIESLISDAYETSMAIVRNDVIKTLDRLARNAGVGAGAIAERIPVKELRGSVVDPLEAIESAAKNAGLSRPDIVALRDMVEGAIGDEKANIFRPAMINEKGEAIAFFRDGGELRALRLADGKFGKEMYQALTGMGPVEKNFFIEMLAWPARILRIGITAAPEFILANVIRDQVLSAVFYGKPFKRLASTLKGATDDVLGRDTARLYSSVYGLSGGAETAGLAETMVKRDLQGLRRKGWATQRLSSFSGIFEATELAETATRIGLFKTFVDEAKARGLDNYEAAMEASWQARSFIDFDRRGSGMGAAAKIIPFLNASLQGLDKFRMHMLTPVAKKMMGETLNVEESRALGQSVKSWARLAALVTLSTSLYALMSRNEDQDEISVQTRSTHWMVKWGDKWIAVPKPHELAVFANLGEAAYDAISRNDATAFSKWGDSLFYTLTPPSIIEGNPAISSYFEMKANKSFFTGAPIVPEHLQGMEPFQQYTEKTSKLSRQIGGMFGLAPVEWDHLILAHTGSIGRGLLSLYDMAQPDAPGYALDDAPISRRFIKDASRGSQSVTRFWEMAAQRGGELEGKAATWRSLFETGDAAGAADYLAKQKDEAKAYISIAMMDAKTARLHPMVRARGAVQSIGAVRRDLTANRLTDRYGDPIEISSAARTAADDILSKMAMAIERNALVAIGEPGWSQRAEIDEQGFYRELQAVSPELTQRLADAYATKKVWDWDAVKAAWPDLRSRAIAEGSEAITLDLVRTVEAEGNPLEGGVKIKRKQKPALIPAPQ